MYAPEEKRILFQVARDQAGVIETSAATSKMVSDSMLNSPGMAARGGINNF
jgi:hypothetical protein